MSRSRTLALLSGLVLAAVVGFAAPGRGQSSGSRLTWSPTTAPGTFDYGRVSSASRELTLTNPGGASLGDLTIALSASPAFRMTLDECTGVNLTSHRSCRVIVDYAPSAVCTRDRAVLRATGRRSTGISIDLTGTSPAVRTTVASPTPAGETHLTVASGRDICVGQTITVGDATHLEPRTVAAIGAATTTATSITVTTAFVHAHAAGEAAIFTTP